MSDTDKQPEAPKSPARVAAEERAAAWQSLTPEEQLTAIDSRLGKGVGAGKQRAKLQQQIAAREAARAAKKTGLKGSGAGAPPALDKSGNSDHGAIDKSKGPASPKKSKKT